MIDPSHAAPTAVAALSAFIPGYLLARWRAARRLERLRTECSSLRAALESSVGRFKASDEYQTILELEHHRGHAEGASAAIAAYKSSDAHDSTLKLRFQEGWIEGGKEERARFQITYTPVLVQHDGFFSKKVDAGYDMQLHYDGLPIGDPTRRITHHQEQSKEENVKRLLDLVEQGLKVAATVAGDKKISVRVDKPKRVKS